MRHGMAQMEVARLKTTMKTVTCITTAAGSAGAGYLGYVSMEPFNAGVQQSENLQSWLRDSFSWVNAGFIAKLIA